MSDLWDMVAGAWEANADFVDTHLADPTRVMLDTVAVAEGDDVLDLACGPGGAGLAAVSRVGSSGSVVLADEAPGMIAAAARRAAGLDMVSTLLSRQDEIPVADGTFDVVINRHGLMFTEDPAAAVAEAIRTLRPGGRYGAMTWGRRFDNPWLGLALDAVADEFGAPFPPAGVLGPFSLDDPALLADALEQGGLREVRVQRLAASMSAKSPEVWWTLVSQLAGPLPLALEGMEPEVRDSIRDRAIRSGKALAGDSGEGIEMSGSVLIATGRRP